jgi:hypothetical protein
MMLDLIYLLHFSSKQDHLLFILLPSCVHRKPNRYIFKKGQYPKAKDKRALARTHERWHPNIPNRCLLNSSNLPSYISLKLAYSVGPVDKNLSGLS